MSSLALLAGVLGHQGQAGEAAYQWRWGEARRAGSSTWLDQADLHELAQRVEGPTGPPVRSTERRQALSREGPFEHRQDGQQLPRRFREERHCPAQSPTHAVLPAALTGATGQEVEPSRIAELSQELLRCQSWDTGCRQLDRKR